MPWAGGVGGKMGRDCPGVESFSRVTIMFSNYIVRMVTHLCGKTLKHTEFYTLSVHFMDVNYILI